MDLVNFEILPEKGLDKTISESEQIFAVLHHLSPEHFTNFSITYTEKQLSFNTTTPSRYSNFLKNQILAQFPSAEIVEKPNSEPEINQYTITSSFQLESADFLPLIPLGNADQQIDFLLNFQNTLIKQNLPDTKVELNLKINSIPDILSSKIFQYTKLYSSLNSKLFKKLFSKSLSKYINSQKRSLRILKALLLTKKFKSKKNHSESFPHTQAELKSKGQLFAVKIDLILKSQNPLTPEHSLYFQDLLSTFKKFNHPELNSFKPTKPISGPSHASQKLKPTPTILLSAKELSSLFHLPTTQFKSNLINWVKSKKIEAPTYLPHPALNKDLMLIGETNYRLNPQTFGIKSEDRSSHLQILGKSGMGKSLLLENMIKSDLDNQNGLCIIDPNGDLADFAIKNIPQGRINDVIIIDPNDTDWPIAFNPFESTDDFSAIQFTQNIMQTFRYLLASSMNDDIELILSKSILSVCKIPKSTIFDLKYFFSNSAKRLALIKKIKDRQLKNFWSKEFKTAIFKKYQLQLKTLHRFIEQLENDKCISPILSQSKPSFNLRWAMDYKKIVILILPKEKSLSFNLNFLSNLFLSRLQAETIGRNEFPEQRRKPFFVYIDDFNKIFSPAFIDYLKQGKPSKLAFILANQSLRQIPPHYQSQLNNQIGSQICFRLSQDDAQKISDQFGNKLLPDDFINLPKFNAYIRLTIDGIPSTPFSMNSFSPINQTEQPTKTLRKKITKKTLAKDNFIPLNLSPADEHNFKIRKIVREKYCQPLEKLTSKSGKKSKTKSPTQKSNTIKSKSIKSTNKPIPSEKI